MLCTLSICKSLVTRSSNLCSSVHDRKVAVWKRRLGSRGRKIAKATFYCSFHFGIHDALSYFRITMGVVQFSVQYNASLRTLTVEPFLAKCRKNKSSTCKRSSFIHIRPVIFLNSKSVIFLSAPLTIWAMSYTIDN